jgi:hypothetical protein
MIAEWLATYRAVRLLQRDDVWPLPELREQIMNRYGASRWSVLLDCPGCLSVWVAAGLGLLASSAVAVILSEWMERREADTTGG